MQTEEERRIEQWALKKQVGASVHTIWQNWAERHRNADPGSPEGINAESQQTKWFKQYEQLRNCQAQWVGYRASCCGEATRPMAVPIGCNHRLCPLCSHHRSLQARKKIRTLFDRLTHPVLITLTVPNVDRIHKGSYSHFRKRARQFIAQHSEWIQGGVYSLETTYNRVEKTWHIHVHILADVCTPLPPKTEKVMLAGERVFAFTAIKLKLEFDWMRLWKKAWGKKARRDAERMRKAGDTFTFEEWVRAGRAMRVKERQGREWRTIQGLSKRTIEERMQWNRENRRVIDVRPVTDRDGAAKEVLKYLTKCADFADLPEAIEPFMNAVKGTRMIQTFGTWYGVDLDTSADFDPENFEDWGEMKCACGCNTWERMGVFFRSDVEMTPEGRWYLKRHIKHNCRGTVPRPTIRALEPPPEESDEQLCQMQWR
jgi:plasmid rolling circle replication initiator protein Rep